MPDFFSRLSIKFQGHIGQKLVDFQPNWVFTDYNSSFNSPTALKWSTKLSIEEVPYCFSRSSIKFQGHTGWKIEDLNPISVRLLGQSQLSNPSDLPCFLMPNRVFQTFRQPWLSVAIFFIQTFGKCSLYSSVRWLWNRLKACWVPVALSNTSQFVVLTVCSAIVKWCHALLEVLSFYFVFSHCEAIARWVLIPGSHFHCNACNWAIKAQDRYCL